MTAEISPLRQQGADANKGADHTKVEVTKDKTDIAATFTRDHRRMLEQAGIRLDLAARLGLRSVGMSEELPDSLQMHEDALPGLLFPWFGIDGVIEYQLRPDMPFELNGEPRKYLQAAGTRLVTILGDRRHACRVYLVEGTKQTLAARCWAPPDVLVVGIPGCHNAMKDGQLLPGICEVIEDLPVTVIFDADLTTKESVLLAAQRLKDALELEGASTVRFAKLPGGGSSGLDDLLGGRAPEKRQKFLERLTSQATKRLPKRVPESPASLDYDGRPSISVAIDRLDLIEEILSAMSSRWDGWRLFDHGGAITELKEGRTTPLDRGLLLAVLAETAHFFRPTMQGQKPAWPDGNVVLAIAAMAGRFTPLDRVSRAPFLRTDGTICQDPGYDAASRTFLVEDPELGQVMVPDDPSATQVSAAVDLLLNEWFGDLPLNEPSDRANLLALVLTPFVRGLMPLVPLAVIDGLMMGVGKNLTADCISLLCSGSHADPLPFPNDDDEVRKVITSTYGTGAELFVFDEAHFLSGRSMARALTAINYTDRILGVSRMARYPNSVTWIALGNQVQVAGDLARRVYRIGLRPNDPDPERRASDQFRHPDLRAWTRENRARLIEAALTLIRAWFAAGQPKAPTPVSFGSFESWERILGGILHHAGVSGFLRNLSGWRTESDFDTGYWEDHLNDVWVQFGEDPFTIHEVVQSMQNGGITELPPGLYNFASVGYGRDLGQAYSRVRDRWFGRYRLVRAGVPGAGGARRKVNTWRIEEREETPPDPDREGWEGREGTPSPSGETFSGAMPYLRPAHTAAGMGAVGDPSHPSPPSRDMGPHDLRALASGQAAAAREVQVRQIAEALTRQGLRVDAALVHSRVEPIRSRRQRLQRQLSGDFGFPLIRADGKQSSWPWASRAGAEQLAAIVSGSTWLCRDGRPRYDQEALSMVAATEPDGQVRLLAEIIAELQVSHAFEFALAAHLRHGRVHPAYSCETATGRWTARDPNVLGVGRRTPELLAQRDYILAEPNHVLIGVDLDGIDARAVAGLAGDASYAQLLEPGVDIHAEVSTLFFGHPGQREQAKAITHGLNYGQGAHSLAARLDRPVQEMQELIDRYFGAYPDVRAWQEGVRKLATETALPTGTGRFVTVDSKDAWTAAPARIAQAAARDLAMTGLLRLREDGLLPYLRLFVHDEVVLSVPGERSNEMTMRAAELMSFRWQSPSGLIIPVTATPHARNGRRWSDLYAPSQEDEASQRKPVTTARPLAVVGRARRPPLGMPG